MSLIAAQTFWGSFVKTGTPLEGSIKSVLTRVLISPKVWLGGLFYIFATIIYFILLSKHKFFSIQLTMTVLAIVFSALLSVIVFHEKLNLVNILGMLIMLIGIFMVFTK